MFELMIIIAFAVIFLCSKFIMATLNDKDPSEFKNAYVRNARHV